MYDSGRVTSWGGAVLKESECGNTLCLYLKALSMTVVELRAGGTVLKENECGKTLCLYLMALSMTVVELRAGGQF